MYFLKLIYLTSNSVFCTMSVLNITGPVCFEKHLILTVVFI